MTALSDELHDYRNLLTAFQMFFSLLIYCFNRQCTFFVLTDLRSPLPLGPVTLVLLLLPEGRVLVVGGLQGVLSGASFFSARFFWDATLLFSLKVNDLLSWVLPLFKSMCCPPLIRSR